MKLPLKSMGNATHLGYTGLVPGGGGQRTGLLLSLGKRLAGTW